jgi:hypothetical protein
MNKRFMELAEQAGYERDFFGVGHWEEPECRKLAELIVKECASVAVQDDEPDLSGNPHMDLNGAYTAGKVSASIMIQEHFGIGE